MFWHARGLDIPACLAKLADSGRRRPSKAMAASMSSWSRSSKGSRKVRPRTAAKGSTISASRGQGRGVVEVATLQSGGGSRRWRTRWRTLLTTATLLSQRAKPSPLWSRLCPKTRIGQGLARTPRVGCNNRGGEAAGVSPRRTVRRAWRGMKWRELPLTFWRWCATGQGRWCTPKFTISPPRFWGRSLHIGPWREGHRALFRAHGVS